jgi:hypothetical protein
MSVEKPKWSEVNFALPAAEHTSIRCYESVAELWIDHGLPIAMSVLDHPP